MKTGLAVIVALVLSVSSALAQLVPFTDDAGQAISFNGLQMVDSLTGYGVTAASDYSQFIIYSTADGGATWIQGATVPFTVDQAGGFNFAARGATLMISVYHYVEGTDDYTSQVQASFDGGATWSDLTAGVNSAVEGVLGGGNLGLGLWNVRVSGTMIWLRCDAQMAGSWIGRLVLTSSDQGVTWQIMDGVRSWGWETTVSDYAAGYSPQRTGGYNLARYDVASGTIIQQDMTEVLPDTAFVPNRYVSCYSNDVITLADTSVSDDSPGEYALVTTDGGVSYSMIYNSETAAGANAGLSLSRIAAFSAVEAYAVVDDWTLLDDGTWSLNLAKVIQTIDGGANWTDALAIAETGTEYYFTMQVDEANNVYIVRHGMVGDKADGFYVIAAPVTE